MRKLILCFAVSLAAVQGCGGDENAGDRAMAIATLSGDATAGGTFFSQQCAVCHDANAMGIAGLGSDLTETVPTLTDAEVAQAFLSPPDGMISFSAQQDQTLADVIAYLRTL